MMDDDDYTFWRGQIAGENPDPTPGEPGCGFYFLRRRITVHDSTQLGRKKRVEHVPETIAIWKDNGTLVMLKENAAGESRVTSDHMAIDNTFARVCRNAIDHETYLLGPAAIDLSHDRSVPVKEAVRRSVEFMKGESA